MPRKTPGGTILEERNANRNYTYNFGCVCLRACSCLCSDSLCRGRQCVLQGRFSKSAIQLTTSGKEEQAALSPDRQMAVFVWQTPGKTVKTGSGPADATELWIVRVDGTGAKRIVAGRPAAKMDSVLAGFRDPQSPKMASASSFLVPHGPHGRGSCRRR